VLGFACRRSEVYVSLGDRRLYRQRNQIERRFRRLKGVRRVFTRYDKLDTLFRGFILFALCWISVSTP
jgi:transposase